MLAIPTGGTTGQVLAKTAGTDYATAWTTPSGGGSLTVASTTTSTTVATNQIMIANGSSLTITAPSAVTAGANAVTAVKNINASTLTLKTTAGNIDGTPGSTGISLTIGTTISLISDGTDWWVY
jgi:hypothetical protein